MEKPDEKGFVHVNWPSKSIPHGGVFHTKVVEPSTEQQRFLKVLLEESKLTIAQRRKGAYILRQHGEVQATRKETPPPLVRPRTSRRRSLSAIRESGIYIVDDAAPVTTDTRCLMSIFYAEASETESQSRLDSRYRPVKKGQNREELKDNLVQQMAYGDKELRSSAPRLKQTKPQIRLPTKKEQWNDLVTQIRERADWLTDMEYLGQGAQYRDLVNGQIAERMRALDALGVDSEVSTARSNVSCSSKPTSRLNVRSAASAVSRHSRKSTSSSNKQRCHRESSKAAKEENVTDYEKLTPLQFSPRRRV